MVRSANVGTAGSEGRRVGHDTASAFARPERMWGSADATWSKYACTLPASRSLIAGDAPRYGMCTMNVPVLLLNSSAHMWLMVPMPAEANDSRPGCRLSSLMKPLPACLVQQELAREEVVAPFPERGIEMENGYYLCYPSARAAMPALLAFKDWLLGEAAAHATR